MGRTSSIYALVRCAEFFRTAAIVQFGVYCRCLSNSVNVAADANLLVFLIVVTISTFYGSLSRCQCFCLSYDSLVENINMAANVSYRFLCVL